MASAFAHAAAALALGTAFRRRGRPARFWITGAALAVLPDADAIGYRLGVPYDSVWGHRGFTHSILFAAIVATVALRFFRDDELWHERRKLWLYFFFATVSHGLLDAMTNGGLGVAFFAPFYNRRFFLPWQPIEVSPLSIRRFFTPRGIAVIVSEFIWVWIPAVVFVICAGTIRSRRGRSVAPMVHE